jgi:hypothetical protein
MNNLIRKISFTLAALVFALSSISAQDKVKKEKVRNKFTYEKQNDGSAILNAYIFKKGANGWDAVSGIDLNFSVKGDETVKIGNVTTDKDGNATFTIDKDFKIPFDSTGQVTFNFKFKGNDSLKSASGKLKLISANLSLILNEGDMKAVMAKVTDINGNPLEKVKIAIGVQRMHSILPLAEERTDSTGIISIDFPTDIPGDYQGNLEIVAQIEKDRKYGSHISKKTIDWGVKNTYVVSEDEKNLWTSSAPPWMLFLVFTVFAVVGFFFLYAMKEVYLMTKDQ